MNKSFALLCLCVLVAGCEDPVLPPTAKQADCHKQASDRLALYSKPDDVTMTEAKKKSAIGALYDECMRDRQKYYTRQVDTTHAKAMTQASQPDATTTPGVPGVQDVVTPSPTLTMVRPTPENKDLELIIGKAD